ncbi:MAG TPA: oligosaccharide flippase family protein [Arsenicitalea sp.]|jgi:PST family polysaccharide transporter|nr:oligosaccharide flippase family protein [Arsenicitalea sp.]
MVEQSNSKTTSTVGAKTMIASFWLITGFMFRRVTQLAITVILARLLVPADFGLVALATTLLLSLMSITELSLFNALIHEREPAREDYDTAFTFSALRGIALAAIMAVGGFGMAYAYHDDRLLLVTAALGLKPLLGGFTSPFYVMLAKNLSFGRVTFWESAAAASQVVASVAVALLTGSYWAIVAGVVVASVVGLVASYWCAPYRPRLSVASWRKLMSFSAWMTLNQIASVVGNRFDNFLGGGILGTAAFGAYNVGNNVASLVTQSALQPLERVLFPSFATIVDNKARLRNAFQRSQACLLAVGLPLGFGLAVVAEPFVYVILGPKWPIAATVIEYIAPVLAVQIVFGPQNALAYSLGATRMLFNRSLVLLIVRIPIVFAGLYFFGMTGLLVSRVISGGIMVSIVNMYMVRTLIGISPWDQVRVAWRSVVSTAVMMMAVLLVRSGFGFHPIHDFKEGFVMLVTCVSTGAIVYCAVHAGLWLMSGRPGQGIESEIVRIVEKLAGRWPSRRRQPAQ